jgi:hypothetical protein
MSGAAWGCGLSYQPGILDPSPRGHRGQFRRAGFGDDRQLENRVPVAGRATPNLSLDHCVCQSRAALAIRIIGVDLTPLGLDHFASLDLRLKGRDVLCFGRALEQQYDQPCRIELRLLAERILPNDRLPLFRLPHEEVDLDPEPLHRLRFQEPLELGARSDLASENEISALEE